MKALLNQAAMASDAQLELTRIYAKVVAYDASRLLRLDPISGDMQANGEDYKELLLILGVLPVEYMHVER